MFRRESAEYPTCGAQFVHVPAEAEDQRSVFPLMRWTTADVATANDDGCWGWLTVYSGETCFQASSCVWLICTVPPKTKARAPGCSFTVASFILHCGALNIHTWYRFRVFRSRMSLDKSYIFMWNCIPSKLLVYQFLIKDVQPCAAPVRNLKMSHSQWSHPSVSVAAAHHLCSAARSVLSCHHQLLSVD